MDPVMEWRTARLLELLREAGDERVSLDELEVAGAPDPARTLFELELAGFTLERVYETAARGPVECVRLTSPEPARLPATASPAAAAHTRSVRLPLLAALALLLLGLGW